MTHKIQTRCRIKHQKDGRMIELCPITFSFILCEFVVRLALQWSGTISAFGTGVGIRTPFRRMRLAASQRGFCYAQALQNFPNWKGLSMKIRNLWPYFPRCWLLLDCGRCLPIQAQAANRRCRSCCDHHACAGGRSVAEHRGERDMVSPLVEGHARGQVRLCSNQRKFQGRAHIRAAGPARHGGELLYVWRRLLDPLPRIHRQAQPSRI